MTPITKTRQNEEIWDPVNVVLIEYVTVAKTVAHPLQNINKKKEELNSQRLKEKEKIQNFLMKHIS